MALTKIVHCLLQDPLDVLVGYFNCSIHLWHLCCGIMMDNFEHLQIFLMRSVFRFVALSVMIDSKIPNRMTMLLQLKSSTTIFVTTLYVEVLTYLVK